MNHLIINQGKDRIPRSFIAECLTYFANNLRKKKIPGLDKDSELTVVFMGPSAARKLNCRFRHKDYATDILSFDGLEPESLGELVLCLDVVKVQAKDHELSFQEELSYLLLHGLLHLLGYDHEQSKSEADKMFKLQDALWDSFWRSRR